MVFHLDYSCIGFLTHAHAVKGLMADRSKFLSKVNPDDLSMHSSTTWAIYIPPQISHTRDHFMTFADLPLLI